MHSFFAPIIEHLELIIEHGGYAVLFLVTILEGVPIIGPFVPGHTIVILSGFLAKIGVLNIYYIALFVPIGAFLGDTIGYMTGRKFGFIFLQKFGKFFFIKDEHVERVKKIVSNHSGKSIIFGRFSPLTRALSPYIVGASGIRFKHFALFNAFGVVLWASASIALGFIFGASYRVAALFFGKFVVVAILLSILIVWGYHFINRQFHIFAKYELITLFFNLLGIYVFFKMIQDAISTTTPLVAFDVWLNLTTTAHLNHSLTHFFKFITHAFSPTSLMAVIGIGICYFLYRRQWRYAAISFLSFGGAMFLSGLIKDIVMRVRPTASLIVETNYSFPSGHATAIMVFCVLVVYFFARKIKSLTLRETLVVCVVTLTVLVGFSRIYLGVHWFSDVVAGFSLGLAWTTLIILLVRYFGMIARNFGVFLGKKR